MASAKDLKKKLRSISNTKKITRTMELVATVKSKRAQDRVNASTPYSRSLAEILQSLVRAGTIRHQLLEAPAKAERILVLVVTGNRGFCGGYNSNALALAERTIREEEKSGRKVDVYMAGRKGIARFRFLKIPVLKSFLTLDENATFAIVEKVAEELMGRFTAGEVGKVLVVSTRYHSAGIQRPAVFQLLPIGVVEGEPGSPSGGRPQASPAGLAAVEYLFEPDPRAILESLLPLSVKTALYRAVLEASTSEQIARRMAMKTATDNAEDMIKRYTRFYNRTRQAGITQQINEIVSGASALE